MISSINGNIVADITHFVNNNLSETYRLCLKLALGASKVPKFVSQYTVAKKISKV